VSRLHGSDSVVSYSDPCWYQISVCEISTADWQTTPSLENVCLRDESKSPMLMKQYASVAAAAAEKGSDGSEAISVWHALDWTDVKWLQTHIYRSVQTNQRLALHVCLSIHICTYVCICVCSYLPTHVNLQLPFSNKVFCGTYSQDGNLFLTACQGLSAHCCVLHIWICIRSCVIFIGSLRFSTGMVINVSTVVVDVSRHLCCIRPVTFWRDWRTGHPHLLVAYNSLTEETPIN